MHQQLLIIGVLMPDGGDHRQLNGVLAQLPTGAGPADPPAASGSGVPGYALGALRRAARELFANRHGELADELLVLGLAPFHIA